MPEETRAAENRPAQKTGTEWGDGPLDRFCFAVEEWSETLTVWLRNPWAKRAALLAGVVIVGGIALGSWLRRGPSAEEIEGERHRQLLQATAQQMPHLSAETVELVMSTSVVGVLDALEVFRRAYDAGERGARKLSLEEAAELRALRREMVASLRLPERSRLQEYDLARRSRVTVPFEDREALALIARGAESLSPTKRARLQMLYGKSIAATLAR
jgi:hypothetical protein